jgi:hypothetical protein
MLDKEGRGEYVPFMLMLSPGGSLREGMIDEESRVKFLEKLLQIASSSKPDPTNRRNGHKKNLVSSSTIGCTVSKLAVLHED